MERKLGEVFTYKGKTYQVVKFTTCKDCAFSNVPCNSFQTLVAGNCTPEDRKDNINVAFREIKGMEIKNNQLTINIPEGMEIDLENSDLTKGIVKFKKKDITYDDILQAYATDFGSLVVSSRNIDKLLAVSKLMDIAKYYNKNWKPNWSNSKENKFCIKFDYHKDRLYVDYNNSIGAGDVFFKNSEDARTVINNPNFRDILNAIYKN